MSIYFGEWVGISLDNVGSCRYIVENELIKGLLHLRLEQIRYFDGLSTDLAAECALTNKVIAQHVGQYINIQPVLLLLCFFVVLYFGWRGRRLRETKLSIYAMG